MCDHLVTKKKLPILINWLYCLDCKTPFDINKVHIFKKITDNMKVTNNIDIKETVNGLKMVQCGDYFWEALKEYDGSNVYRIMLKNKNFDILVLYGEGNFTIRYYKYANDSDFFIFKIDFDKTPMLIKALLDGEGCTLSPIYHKDTIKLK